MSPVKKSQSSAGLAPGKARVIGKTELAVNLSGIEAGRKRRRVRIPEGEYRAKLVKAEISKASTGNDMITWLFNLIDAEELNGTPFWYRTVLAESSLWNCRKVLEALGVKIADSMMKINLGNLAGRTCGLEIVDGEYEGTIRSEVADVFPESELSESDDEDEEEEDEGDEEDEEEESEESEEEEEEEIEEEEEEEEEVDLDSLDLNGLKAVAKQYGVSIKPPAGRDRISSKLLKERILAAIEEAESDDEEEDEIDLDDEEL